MSLSQDIDTFLSQFDFDNKDNTIHNNNYDNLSSSELKDLYDDIVADNELMRQQAL